MPKIVIGVMGPGDATQGQCLMAHRLGELIAQAGWVLLTGGRNCGVMHFTSQGASQAGGLTVGILPEGDGAQASPFVDIVIATDMGSARNNINILSSDVVIALGMGPGTASEVALALKAGKKVILLANHEESKRFFNGLKPGYVRLAQSPEEAIELVKQLLEEQFARKTVQ